MCNVGMSNQLVALMAAPSKNDRKEAVTVADTVSRLEELQETFAADLAAPVQTLQEVCTKRILLLFDFFLCCVFGVPFAFWKLISIFLLKNRALYFK